MIEKKLSSNLTRVSQVMMVVLGPLIAVVTGSAIHWGFAGIIISMSILGFALFFSFRLSDLYFEETTGRYRTRSLVGSEFQFEIGDIAGLTRWRDGHGYAYYWFTVGLNPAKLEKFLVVSPLWGAEKKTLKALHDRIKEKSAQEV